MKRLLCFLVLSLPALACNQGALVEWAISGLFHGLILLSALFLPSILGMALLKLHRHIETPAALAAGVCGLVLSMALLNLGLSVADVYLAVAPFAYLVARIGQRLLPNNLVLT